MDDLSTHVANAGFIAADSSVAVRRGSVITGSKNVTFDSRGRNTAHSGPVLQASVAGGRTMSNLSDGGYASLGDAATNGIGSIVGLIAGAFGYIGAGPLYLNGISRSVNASTTLQIILKRLGVFTGANTGPYVAGVEQATAPTIAEHSVNTSTTNSGTTSAVIWFVRSATGGRGRKSPPSNILVVNGKTVRLTVAGGDLTTATTFGYDRIGIGVTQWGFGATGPHYEEREIAISSLTVVDAVANSVELQWASATLSGRPLAPIDDYPPPAGVFAAALQDVLAVIGCYGDSTSGITATTPGTAIAVSLPVFIESFPPDSLLFLPEPPVGVISRPSGGFAFVGCRNSMHALVYKGGAPPALGLQTIWATTGIPGPNAMCLGEGGRLYAMSNGRRGLVRIGEQGEPETEWAADVSGIVSAWTPADVIAGWDNDTQHVVFGHNKELLAFNTQTQMWAAPIDLSGILTANEKICAAVTVAGTLLIAVRDTVTTANPIRLFAFSGGTGSTYEIYFPWEESQAHADEIFEVTGSILTDNTVNAVTLRLYVNGDRSTVVASKTFTPTRTGKYPIPLWRPNVRGARSSMLYASQASSGGICGVELLRLRGVRSGVAIG